MPTSSTKKPTMIQPRMMTRGPPVTMPSQKLVMPPARIEMIEKLMAKLLNHPIPRFSSCAYPSELSCARSSSIPSS